ncbi:hypothetical protein AXF42_Ash006409 [Apostasia shenzhenica]|uniref:Uncharacterized protein n=1 Tax=Apostasia shenzhenica TaxID=1088818 RepID=A0A2I0AZ15_9ASPA|nr:hypothetical protein AXF42_Ash006409 [Apostasia shenzhenica]
MPAADEDLDLLLSLAEEEVPETPPRSANTLQSRLSASGYTSDDGSPRRSRIVDMSVFRDSVKDYLKPVVTAPAVRSSKTSKQKRNAEVEIDKFSGLRILNPLVSSTELSNLFSDMRFVRMSAIRNLLSGDTLSGFWATVGVLTEKGVTKVSSAGKNYSICKMGCLDETTVSVFLFGDAYAMTSNERVGAMFALFNATVRRDSEGKGFSLSVYSVSQILKLGTSSDYGVCKGQRKDGMACSMIINKTQGLYCKFHSSKSSQRYTTTRAELKGGNIQMAFRTQLEGVYMVDPQASKLNWGTSVQPVKVMSVDGLQKVLSNADKLTSNSHSQGIRFLSKITAKMQPNLGDSTILKPNEAKTSSGKRTNVALKKPCKNETEAKRKKVPHSSVNMIELDIISSEED